jgi:hypothetical protein
MKRMRTVILFIAAAMMMSCSSYTNISTVSLADRHADSVQTGNYLRIKMRDASLHYLEVTAIDSERIAGVETVVIHGDRAKQTIVLSRAEIVRIQRERNDPLKTLGLIISIPIILLLLFPPEGPNITF